MATSALGQFSRYLLQNDVQWDRPLVSGEYNVLANTHSRFVMARIVLLYLNLLAPSKYSEMTFNTSFKLPLIFF